MDQLEKTLAKIQTCDVLRNNPKSYNKKWKKRVEARDNVRIETIDWRCVCPPWSRLKWKKSAWTIIWYSIGIYTGRSRALHYTLIFKYSTKIIVPI